MVAMWPSLPSTPDFDVLEDPEGVGDQDGGGVVVLLCQIKMLASDHVGTYNATCLIFHGV
jgi:hypothetical protein